MIDMRQDMKQAEVWLNETEGEMSEDQLIYLAATGFECVDSCQSKKYCKDEACACIRATFPTPDHYHFYLTLRSHFIDLMKRGIIAGSFNTDAFDELKARRKQDEDTNINKRGS